VGAILPSTPLFATFLAASFLLAVTPGPGVVYIVTRSITQGVPQGLLRLRASPSAISAV
jgi:threonine/homoserine/homoserine lactone efflux protein